MSDLEKFEAVLQRFDRLMRVQNKRYALIGGIAVILQGHQRATRDVDATVWDIDSDLQTFVQNLGQGGFHFRMPDGYAFAKVNRVLLLSTSEGIDFDVSMGFLPFELAMIEGADHLKVSENLELPVAKPEALVIMKVIAGRPRDIEDARSLMALFPEIALQDIRATLEEFAEVLESPEIVKRFENLVKEAWRDE